MTDMNEAGGFPAMVDCARQAAELEAAHAEALKADRLADQRLEAGQRLFDKADEPRRLQAAMREAGEVATADRIKSEAARLLADTVRTALGHIEQGYADPASAAEPVHALLCEREPHEVGSRIDAALNAVRVVRTPSNGKRLCFDVPAVENAEGLRAVADEAEAEAARLEAVALASREAERAAANAWCADRREHRYWLSEQFITDKWDSWKPEYLDRATQVLGGLKRRKAETAAALADLTPKLDAARLADAPGKAAANADFTMLRVTVRHVAEGKGGLAHLCSSYEPDTDEDGEGEHDDHDERANAVRSALGAAYDYLATLGAIRCDDLAGDGPSPATFWLPVEGGGWRPAGAEGDAPAIPFGEYDVAVDGLKGVTLKVRCEAEPMLPSDGYAAIALTPDNERVGYWGGNETADRLPGADEGRADWLKRVAVPAGKLTGALERLEAANFNIPLFASILDPDAAVSSEDRYLVERMFAYGCVSLVAGEGEAGKSTQLHSLLTAIGSKKGPREFLGQAIVPAYDPRRPLVLLTGEEGAEEVAERQVMFNRTWDAPFLFVMPGSGPDALAAALERLDVLPDYGVLVVDSYTKFSGGNDADAHVASAFYNPLIEFARRKNWAVIVIHHLAKGAGPMRDRVRGSVEHINAPRIVIGLERQKAERTRVSVLKCNFVGGAWLKRDEHQIFDFDPDTLRLSRLDQKTLANDQDVRAVVLSSIRQFNAKGWAVFRTGAKSLFAQSPEEVAGIPRAKLDAAITGLLELGQLTATDGGLFVACDAQAA